MVKTLSSVFYKISRKWALIASLLVFILFTLTVLPDQSRQAEIYSGDIGSPDLSLFYSAEKLFKMAEVYGPDGRQAYVRARFSFDLVFPLVYAFFLVVWISWLLNKNLKKESSWRLLNLLPLAAMTLDFLENISAAWVIGSYPARYSFIALLAGIFTPLKWLFVSLSFLTLAGAACFHIIKTIIMRVTN